VESEKKTAKECKKAESYSKIMHESSTRCHSKLWAELVPIVLAKIFFPVPFKKKEEI